MSDHTRSGLPENIAALLSYVLGWVTGLVFLLIDKRFAYNLLHSFPPHTPLQLLS